VVEDEVGKTEREEGKEIAKGRKRRGPNRGLKRGITGTEP